MQYAFWYAAFRFALFIEARAVWLRDLSQRRKMALVKPVPEFWESMRSW